MSVSRMIRGHELFQSFSFEEVESISTFSGAKEYGAGERVFERGEQGSHFFVVLEGQVSLKLPSADDVSSLVVGRMGQGDIFGLSPLLGFDRFTTTAECREDSSVLAIEAEPFRALLEDNSAVGLKTMTVMARAYFSRYIDTLSRFQHVLDELVLQ